MQLFQLEQTDHATADWWARVNYGSDDNAVRVVLSLDKAAQAWTITVQQEDDGAYGEWIDVFDRPLTADEAVSFLAIGTADDWRAYAITFTLDGTTRTWTRFAPDHATATTDAQTALAREHSRATLRDVAECHDPRGPHPRRTLAQSTMTSKTEKQ